MYSVKKGDMIIDSNQVHIISQIKNDIVTYSPLEKDNKNTTINSIPLKNFSKACIRPLLDKKEIKILLKQISKKESLEMPKNTNKKVSFKDYLYRNDAYEIAKLLIYLHKLNKKEALPNADKAVFDEMLKHLAKEISIVNKKPLQEVKKQILSLIKK